MHIPSETELRHMAVAHGLIREDEPLTREARAEVIRAMARKSQPPPPGTEQTLISRTVTAVNDGHLVIEVWHKPSNSERNRAHD